MRILTAFIYHQHCKENMLGYRCLRRYRETVNHNVSNKVTRIAQWHFGMVVVLILGREILRIRTEKA